MSLDGIPKPWRAPAAMASFAAAIVFAAWAAEARIDDKVQTAEARVDAKIIPAARAAVAEKWDDVYQTKALEACTSAADQGAYRAVSEAMQQTVIPLQRAIDAHVASQAEHEKSDERRFAVIERRLNLR